MKKSWPTPVPAAAVIQGGQALFILIGRKGYVGGFLGFLLKAGKLNLSEYKQQMLELE